MAKVFSKNINSGVIYGNIHLQNANGHDEILKIPEHVGVVRLIQGSIPHQATFIKRELFDKYGLYRQDLKIVSDWDLFLKMTLFSNITFTHCHEIIASYDLDGLSSNMFLYWQERRQVLEEYLSPELLNICVYHPQYEQFYSKKIFVSMRKIQKLFKHLISIRIWKEYVNKKRIHSLIWLSNKTVRKQKANPLSIPIVIINYNRLTDLKKLVSFLLDRKHTNIVIVDNKSSYPPLLEYYEDVKNKVTVKIMDQNYGHLVFWKNEDLYAQYSSGYYVITDSDILPNENLPLNYMDQLVNILDKHKNITKVGFALSIDDLPDFYTQKEKVIAWEQKYWENPIIKNCYRAHLDTTFAVYPPAYRYNKDNFYEGIRVTGKYVARHGGWYINANNPTHEDVYYMNTANDSSSAKNEFYKKN